MAGITSTPAGYKAKCSCGEFEQDNYTKEQDAVRGLRIHANRYCDEVGDASEVLDSSRNNASDETEDSGTGSPSLGIDTKTILGGAAVGGALLYLLSSRTASADEKDSSEEPESGSSEEDEQEEVQTQESTDHSLVN